MKFLVKQELWEKMLSYDWSKFKEACRLITNICNDAIQRITLIDLSDLLIRWLLLR